MADKFNAKLKVSDLDFDTIKTNLKEFLSTQEQFQDINFEGAGINVLMDLLAYNTHYQAGYTNMVANEMFLDSAIRRDSIVSLAKHLGYTPRSITAPTATVDIYSPDALLSQYVEKGTIIKGTQGDSSYNFSVSESVGYTHDSDGLTAAQNVEIKEGRYETLSYVYDGRNDLKYVIPATADTTTLTVRVQKSSTDNTGYTDKWSLSSDLNTVTKTDKAYHIQELDNAEYEVYFGDNVVGKRPDNGNIIILQYLNTSGPRSNNMGSADKESARVFTLAGSTVKVKSAASGGDIREDIKSIKFYAPKAYQAQERAVTSRDYEAIIMRDYADIGSVYVWGGQDNDPPEYGKVFLSIKPKSSLTLDLTKKEEIKKDILKKTNVVTVIPEIVDPDYLFLLIESNLIYDRSKTILDRESIANLVKTTVINYIDTDLEKFDKDLYFSKLTKLMDESSTSLKGNDTKVKLQRRIKPSLNATSNYEIEFGNAFYHPHDGHMSILSSTGFEYKDDDGNVFVGYLDDDGSGKLRMWKRNMSGGKVYVYEKENAIGTIDYNSGKLTLKEFRPLSYENNLDIRIDVPLRDKNVFASRSRIITLDKNDPNSVRISIEEMSDREKGIGTSSRY